MATYTGVQFFRGHGVYSQTIIIIIIIIMTRSVQPKPPAVAIVRQNGLSSASYRASVAVTPVSRQIWPQARLHSCDGRSPFLSPWYRF